MDSKEKLLDEHQQNILKFSNNSKQDIDTIKSYNRTHHIKFNISTNLSVRYHFTFTSNPQLENKWILKFHNEKLIEELKKEVAINLIKETNISSYQEVIGIQSKKEFNKIIINNGNISDLELVSE